MAQLESPTGPPFPIFEPHPFFGALYLPAEEPHPSTALLPVSSRWKGISLLGRTQLITYKYYVKGLTLSPLTLLLVLSFFINLSTQFGGSTGGPSKRAPPLGHHYGPYWCLLQKLSTQFGGSTGCPLWGGPPFGQNHGPYWEPHYSTYIDILAEAQGVPLRGGHFS